jgi:hypothetical protein
MEHSASKFYATYLYNRNYFWKICVSVLLAFFVSGCSPRNTPAPPHKVPILFTATPHSAIETLVPNLEPKTPTMKSSEEPQTPVETILPVSSPAETDTNKQPIAQIGAFRSIFLRYDPAEWETFDEFQTTNPSGERTESLRHKFIAGCVLHENFGRGAPQNWRREDTNRQIGDLVFRVEMWTDTSTHKTPLVVYQYPANEMLIRVELVVNDKPKLCIENAESIIARSSDLIASQAGVIVSPTPSCNIGPGSVWNAPSIAIGRVQECLFNSGSRECLINLMKKYDASPDAITFVGDYSEDGFLIMFKETGTVDLGTIIYYGRANDNVQAVMLNGDPCLVFAEDVRNLNLNTSAKYASLIRKYPNLILWGGDSSLGSMIALPNGGQRFIFSYPLVDGCHACANVGEAQVAFDFDSQGKFLGKLLQ